MANLEVLQVATEGLINLFKHPGQKFKRKILLYNVRNYSLVQRQIIAQFYCFLYPTMCICQKEWRVIA